MRKNRKCSLTVSRSGCDKMPQAIHTSARIEIVTPYWWAQRLDKLSGAPSNSSKYRMLICDSETWRNAFQ